MENVMQQIGTYVSYNSPTKQNSVSVTLIRWWKISVAKIDIRIINCKKGMMHCTCYKMWDLVGWE